MKAKQLFISIFFSCLMSFALGQTAKQFVNAGNEAYDSNDYYEAISYFKNALKFDKNQNELHYKIGKAYYELKEYENALAAFNKMEAGTLVEAFPMLSFYQGSTSKLLGKYDEAVQHFEDFKSSYRENDFFSNKVEQEIASCFWAKEQDSDDEITITHFKKPINTGYSEFAASYFGSTIIQLSSMQPLIKNDKKSPFVSGIYLFQQEDDGWSKASIDLKPLIINDSLELANGYYLEEKQRFYYTLCEAVSSTEKRCDIYVAEYLNNTWSTPIALNINMPDATNTQPTVHVGSNGKDVLYFASDRLGTYGKLDIWRADERSLGDFQKADNLGATVNSIDNESTPFFNVPENKLYFSSEWYYGFGGYDIFYSSKEVKGAWSKPVNAGQPVNSSANDQYLQYYEPGKAFFSSNRQGALQLRGSACCFDIYAMEKEVAELVVETLDTPKMEKDTPVASTPTSFDVLANMLPATVYFHNDEPNPKTTTTTTSLGYDACYSDYVKVFPSYLENFSKTNLVQQFFDNKVKKGYQDLQAFAQQLEIALGENKIALTLEGYCSPLAKNDYNIKLAQRRIASLKNYLLRWNNGALKSAYDSGALSFVNAPFGEEKAAASVSDDYYNTSASIYDPAAAAERKVAVIAVQIK